MNIDNTIIENANAMVASINALVEKYNLPKEEAFKIAGEAHHKYMDEATKRLDE